MSSRLKIERVDCAIEGSLARAQVQLSVSGTSQVGLAMSPVINGSWKQAVAEATLDAVRRFIDTRHTVALDTVTEVTAGRYPLIVVTMMIDSGRGEDFLAGSATILEDRYTAVAKAVLHGLNRKLSVILP